MASSTSHFNHTRLSRANAAIPWLALRLLAVAAGAWVLAALYTLRLNPEVAYDRHAHAVKCAWAAKLETERRSKIIVCGGSSCRTSINGQRLLDRHNLPVLNLGMGASIGAEVLTRYALGFARPGDTLVLALEPGLLIKPIEIEAAGAQFALAIGQPALLREPEHVNWPRALLDLRPGAYHCFTLLGKLALRQALFRYPCSDLHPDGWQEVAARLPLPELVPATLRLCPEAGPWLVRLRDTCAQRGVRLAYALPWYYSRPEDARAFRRQNAGFLLQVSRYLPVLKDPMLGAYTVREHYADTALHLTAEGAAVRSDRFAEQIKTWEMWRPEELRAEADGGGS